MTKRCNCPPAYSAKGERLACKLRHGSWSYVADAGRDPKTGKRRQVKRSGFATKVEAEQALAELVDSIGKGTLAHDERQTLAHFLAEWLTEKERNGLRPTTLRGYRDHIDGLIVPLLGRERLRDLRPTHVEQLLREAAKAGNGRNMGPASIRRLHATVRSALGTAKRRRLITFNPAVDVELPSAPRPRVQPWEPAELGAFLDSIAADRFGSLFELIAATGLRRGEAVGLRWADVDLARGVLVVRQQLVALSGAQPPCAYCGRQHLGAAFGRPKTASGEDRTVELDGGVVGVLMAHRLQQDIERATWGAAYSDHGLVFAREDGTPIAPERVTKRFAQLVNAAGLRSIRLHDLRHGQASLMLAAGVPIAVVSKRLGHSTITLTSDTYSHMLQGVGRDAAERAAALVPRAPKAPPASACDRPIGDQRGTRNDSGPPRER
ncbi:tyrosine-type recombinase/integrase [Jatrophihabitans sp.]|uniref:site-specific integrase n=1 Tax=Jatrophihabitans sp. TaxID=1932789 RepID=UPI002EE84043